MENLCNDRDNLNEFLEEADLQQYYELFRDVLKVTKTSQLKFVVNEDLEQIGLSKPEQRRYKKTLSQCSSKPYVNKLKRILYPKKSDVNSNDHTSFPQQMQRLSENKVKIPTKHIISIEDITVNKELGMGQFGVVQLGTWTTGNQRLQVAIKCLGQERMTSYSPEFLKEAAVMHSIEHPNIVRLYGVVLHMESLMLVTELAPLRSLLECLREVGLRKNFRVPNLCEFAEQICDGMTYLENKRLIHRDLAARNILVFNKDRVKISDFGLSRALGVGKDYYQTNYNVNLKLPVAWCAPECILYLRFTSSSDVWAFGVCLWEMFTYGFQPWAAFSGQQILEAIDSPNFQRLERPECCPDPYYTTMLKCWSHDPSARPKFKDLLPRLKKMRPEEVQATADYDLPKEGRRPHMLEYKVGDVITVIEKDVTKNHFWYGISPGGTCGMFDPSNTKPYVKVDKGTSLGSISPHPLRQSARSIRSSLLRSDLKRHTYTGKRSIQRSMISSPQGDLKHTGHVGLDGACFGDISFLDTAGPPRQIVTPYKASEDVEQQPLINPSSPSHLSRASGSPYSLFPATGESRNCDEVDLAHCHTKSKSHKKTSHKTHSEPTTSRNFLNKVKCATLGRSHRAEEKAASKVDEVHEYHEISDTDTESNAADNPRIENLPENLKTPDSPCNTRGSDEFSQDVLDQIDSMFKKIDDRNRNEASAPGKQGDGESFRSQTLSKAEKKKQTFQTGTLKPMSAGEEKTLATAVAMANEITSKSMTDLDGEQKPPKSPSDRTKFQLKLPNFVLHSTQHDLEKEPVGKHERRNFSDEAKSVPDIQSILTEESKHAYTSLIEEPVITTTAMVHSRPHRAVTMPKPAPRVVRPHLHSLPNQATVTHIRYTFVRADYPVTSNRGVNVLPLPPRNSKPMLVDKPRHIRKHPLKLPPKPPHFSPLIYQNASANAKSWPQPQPDSQGPPLPAKPLPSTSKQMTVQRYGVDVCDGYGMKMDQNPFANNGSPANPFDNYLPEDEILDLYYGNETESDSDDEKCNKALNRGNSRISNKTGLELWDLVGTTEYPIICEEWDQDSQEWKSLERVTGDHVSVEDLLEFANLKPCGRQRGVESDEVRIMCKVLKEQVTAQECLQALELSDWNVYRAIKIIRVKIAAGAALTLQKCSVALDNAFGDVVKASAALQSNKFFKY